MGVRGLIGYAFCGSFCTHERSLRALSELIAEGIEVQPIMSTVAYTTSTRFGKSEDLVRRVEELTGKRVIHTVEDAEPLGPKNPLDALIIAPCTGNTLAKLALGITDTAVTMAAKAHLRQDRPLLIALASNDAVSQNLKSIGMLYTRRSVYFVPLSQDDPERKPYSLVAEMERIPEASRAMRAGIQLRPLFT